MRSLLINPKDAKELQLVIDILSKMGVSYNELTEEDKEDIGLSVMMQEADRSQKVSEKEVMNKLDHKKNED